MTATMRTDISESDYHADPCEAPSLSASVAGALIRQSPAHAHAIHPKLGGYTQPPTKEMDAGSLIHHLVLGCGADLEVVDAPDWRTKAPKEARDAAREEGKLPVLRHKLDAAERVAGILRQKINALRLGLDFNDADCECVITWQSQTTHGPIWCRARPDALWRSRGVILDLKSTANARPAACEKSCLSYGYHIQDAAYREALTSLEPSFIGRERFLFIFAELTPPYAVTPAELGGSMRDLGAQQWGRAKDEWAYCLSRDEWPEYGPEIARLEAPPWALHAEMEEAS